MRKRDKQQRPNEAKSRAVLTISFIENRVQFRAQSFNLSERQSSLIDALLVELTATVQEAWGADLTDGTPDAVSPSLLHAFENDPMAEVVEIFERGTDKRISGFTGKCFVLMRCENVFCHIGKGGCLVELYGPETPELAQQFIATLSASLRACVRCVEVGCKAPLTN